MKRLFLILLCMLMISLSACGEPPTMNSDFTSAFTAEYQGAEYAGTVSKEGDRLTITMNAPYTVQGIAFCYQGDELSIRCADHSTNANSEYLPDSGVPTVLHNTLAYLPQAVYISTESGADTFTLPTPYGDATLTAREGVPQSLTDPHSGIEVTFG